jgi:hypothetical protein
MAQTGFTPISLYYTTTAAAVPTAGNLVAGELAINTNDGKLFYKDSSGVVQTIASKAGALGDVVGPASATDNAITRFDATTGKLIQNSVGILTDAGALSGITDFAYTGTLTGGTGIVNLGSGQVYKDASGNVGIGTSSPANKLVVAGSAPRIVSQDTTNNKIAVLRCGDTVGYVGTESNIPFQVLANSNTILNCSTTGAVGLYGASTSATGVGITFPATQNASSDANTLDDYEEGTWTPTIVPTGTAGTYTTSSVSAFYRKIGSQVTVWCDVQFSVASGGSGSLTVGGLPFAYISGMGAGAGNTYLSSVNTTSSSSVGGGTCAASGASASNVFPFLNIDNAGVEGIPMSGISTSSRIAFLYTYIAV